MLNLVYNRNSLLACLADCPADNHARQLAQFLYETLCFIKKPAAQTAHLVFADTKANAEKTKRAVFCQRSKKN